MVTSCQNILVAQLGARRHYAVPLAFCKHGCLARFCTDLYAGPLARTFAPMLPLDGLRRYASRYTGELPRKLVRSYSRFGLAYRRAVDGASSPSSKVQVWMEYGSRFATLVAGDGLGEADGVYAFSSAALELMRAASDHGAFAVLDHATAPRDVEARVLAEEADRFPGWASGVEHPEVTRAYASRQAEERAAADLILCGSSYVQRTLRDADGTDQKTLVVPLGFTPLVSRVRAQHRTDGSLRVLFVGSEGLRKGVGYLAEAAALLSSPHVEIRVAGDLGLTPVGVKALAGHVTVLGPVRRRDLDALYAWADVMVLPSLSDTFGLVLLESMAAGLPVVTTPNTAGPDIVRNGEDGFIVPVRSPEAIAAKLDALAGDPGLLHDMSESARIRAGSFSLDAYGERLVHALGRGGRGT